MSYWEKYLLLYLLLIGAVVWSVWGTGLQMTWLQAAPVWVIIFLHQRLAVLAERHDVERRARRAHYSDSGQEK